jgi:hypothetical protein
MKRTLSWLVFGVLTAGCSGEESATPGPAHLNMLVCSYLTSSFFLLPAPSSISPTG